MKLVVIESPLSGNFKRNLRYARLCALECKSRGESPCASHLFFTQFLDDRVHGDREFGIKAGFEWARHADLVALYWDLGISGGMVKAREYWLSLGIPLEPGNLPTSLMRLLSQDVPLHTPGAIEVMR